MKPKRIVITGGPGTGKTTLINHISKLGYNCLPEISRKVTREAQKEGVSQLFLEDPILFSESVLEGRLQQFREAETQTSPFLFYDRGMPDITAYLDYMETSYPNRFKEVCLHYVYDAVFLLTPWKEIYHSDNERYESWEEAQTIHFFLVQTYTSYAYLMNTVPTGTVSERASWILAKLKTMF